MTSPYLDGVRQDVEMRDRTDRRMSVAWAFLPLLLFIAIIFFIAVAVDLYLSSVTHLSGVTTPAPTAGTLPPSFLGALLLLYPFIAIFALVFALMNYRLIRRRNDHFRRQHFLFSDALSTLKAYADSKGAAQQWLPNAVSLERGLRDVKAEEGEKSAALWVIVSVLNGLAGLYVWYFLMKDFHKHERREEAFLQQLATAASTLGVVITFQPRQKQLPNRSFALYFLLSCITLGIFEVVWIYRLVKDPNEHFASQRPMDDGLFQSLTTVAS